MGKCSCGKYATVGNEVEVEKRMNLWKLELAEKLEREGAEAGEYSKEWPEIARTLKNGIKGGLISHSHRRV
jgi:hypothetical protein